MKYLSLCILALLTTFPIEKSFAAATLEVTWNAVDGADTYTVHYETEGMGDAVLVTTAGAEINLPDFIQGTVAAYVRAHSATGRISAPSEVAYASYYPDVEIERGLDTPNITIKIIIK